MTMPRLTKAEADRLGVGHLYPEPPPSRHEPDGMNKLERAFHARLQEAVRQRIFIAALREPLVLRLAGHTTYKPDFWTIALPSTMTFWEVKGFMRDDAAVKLKVAAAQAPWFRWVLAQRDRGRWRCIDVTERGFSRDEWCPDWLAWGAPLMRSNEPPSRKLSQPEWIGTSDLGRHWECQEYYGIVRKLGRMQVLSITATDETSRHDWRDFQALKNMLIGPEWEAVEIYPAESELKDPSNRFYMWCFRKGTIREKLGAGEGMLPGRDVVGPEHSIAPQRAFPESEPEP